MLELLCWSCNRRPITVCEAWCQECWDDPLCLICKKRKKPDAATKICKVCDLLYEKSKFFGMKNGMKIFIEYSRDG